LMILSLASIVSVFSNSFSPDCPFSQ
jgi:hypothetical protein